MFLITTSLKGVEREREREREVPRRRRREREEEISRSQERQRGEATERWRGPRGGGMAASASRLVERRSTVNGEAERSVAELPRGREAERAERCVGVATCDWQRGDRPLTVRQRSGAAKGRRGGESRLPRGALASQGERRE